MNRLFKEFLFFSRGERRGILVLFALIVLVFLLGHFYIRKSPRPEEAATDTLSYRAFEDTMAARKPAKREKRSDYRRPAVRKPCPLTPFAFDPNTADSLTLTRLGLPGWMARNIVRYREHGGRFRQPADFRKIYGLTEEQYRTLLPYITLRVDTPYHAPVRRDTFKRAYKYPEGTVIGLNGSDTTELKKIPGIGSYTARRIADYRRHLGGYYSIAQLAEIGLDTLRFARWFHVETDSIRLLSANRASIEQLRRHPYINFYQARAIVEYRKKQGKLKSLKPLCLLEEFTQEDMERISRYLSFE